MKKQKKHFSMWMPIFITFSIMGISVIALYNIDQTMAMSMLADDGLIQILTAAVLIVSCIICLQRALRKIPPAFKWAELTFLLLIYAMREMDFHRLFTEEHISRLKLYTGPYPLHEKLIGGIVLFPTIIILLHFIGSHLRFFWSQLKKKQSWAVHVIVWAILLFSSQMLDQSRWNGLALEENMEFGAAIMILLILIKYPISLSHSSEDSQLGLDAQS
jgi:hypothetical protein